MCIQVPTFNLSHYWSVSGPQELHENIFASTHFRSAKPRNLEMVGTLQKPLKKIARQQKHSSGDDHEKSWIGQNAIRFFFQQFYDNYLQYKYTTMNVCLTS